MTTHPEPAINAVDVSIPQNRGGMDYEESHARES